MIKTVVDEKTGEIKEIEVLPKFKTHYSNTKVDAEIIDGEHMTDGTSFIPLKEVIAQCDRRTLVEAFNQALEGDEDDDLIDYSARNGYDLADMPAIAEEELLKSNGKVEASTTTSVEVSEAEQKPREDVGSKIEEKNE